ncbi:Transketolase 2 [bioreactor metagenome]|uniref:Transketolase 2 n=1 Tax=bioreactor metagenome TaxID=1076179 RepID=A0A645CDH3_9ZZZZ|nr:transketolase [Oscillospiraceae bacterium]
MDKARKQELSDIAVKIRMGALECVYGGNSGHPGGSLSIAEILSYLYFEKMNIDPKNPKKADRDRFVLSKGHTCPALYATLANRGYFSTDLLKTFRHSDSILQGHPDMKGIPGVDMSTGSLGLGFSASCGMAKAAKLSGDSYKVYAILGDGELEEGQVWEAAMFAGHYKLNNLCIFIDFNGLQIDGDITKVMNPTPIDDKFRAFNWNVIVIDGHDFDQIEAAVAASEQSDKPTAVVCHCIKGKGVSFMENEASWHGNAPTKEQYEAAIAELKSQLGGNK